MKLKTFWQSRWGKLTQWGVLSALLILVADQWFLAIAIFCLALLHYAPHNNTSQETKSASQEHGDMAREYLFYMQRSHKSINE